MFDSYVLGRTHTEYVPYEKSVKEIRAPTDDSIRIYEEIKEKAYKSILDTLVVNNNVVNFNAIVYLEVYSFSYIVKYKAKINSMDLENELKIHKYDLKDRESVIHKIYEDISKYIAKQMINSFDINCSK